MNALALVIDNYIKRKNIGTYTLLPGHWSAKDWSNGLQLGNGIAFFYGLRVMLTSRAITGGGQSIATYEGANIRLESADTVTSLSMTETYQDTTNSLYLIENDFVAIHTHQVKINTVNGGIVAASGYLNYLLLTPIHTDADSCCDNGSIKE